VKYKPYTDPDWLHTEYVRKKRNCADIAEECGTTEMTIYNWCKEFGLLKLRGKGRNLGPQKIIKRG